MSRHIKIVFICSGCGLQKNDLVPFVLDEHGQMCIDQHSMPEGWSDSLETDRYDHVSDKRRRDITACPKCKFDLGR